LKKGPYNQQAANRILGVDDAKGRGGETLRPWSISEEGRESEIVGNQGRSVRTMG